MTRSVYLSLATALLAGVMQAQTPPPAPQPESQAPRKPRAGTIIENPNAGHIIHATNHPPTEAPAAHTRGRPKPPATVAPSANAGGSALAGHRIERFEATGNTTVASDTIRVYLGIVPGEPYDPAAIQKNFLNLWQTGLFDDIKLEADKADNGNVVIRATVKERPRIGSVEFRGNKDLQTAKINEALEKEKIDLHVGSTIEQSLVRRAAETVKKAYIENGFEDPQVESTMEDLPSPGEKRIVFHITEGIKAKVANVEFIGNKHFSARKLRSVKCLLPMNSTF